MTRLFLALILLATPALADPSITIAFSPHAGATKAVIQVVSEAKQSIHLADYGFTSKRIAQALIAAHQRGVEVEAVLDKSNATHRSEAGELAAAGVPVRIDSRYAIMHDKFIVVDDVTVETGSFNYTRAAEENNAENVLVLRADPEVAARYEAEWRRP
jgi:phosphatidylserine/phosphatidylglycerophosphate/cardiolipin synthase-like enzyme